jgi:hypothetical protein
LKRARKSKITNPVAQELVAQFRQRIPKNEVIVRQALHEVLTPYEGDVEKIKAQVSKVISDAEARAYEAYKEAQRPALTNAIHTVFSALMPPGATASDAVEMFAGNAEALDAFFLSVAQGRKARAGTAVETFFDTLFRGIGYPFEREHVVNGTPDFVFPNVVHFRKLATDCVIFTSKRTLRERWRQITSEGSRGFVLFLGTLDATVKPADLNDIKNQKIMLVVPEHVRAAAYAGVPHVISVEVFLRDHLDPGMERWRRNGVIV